MQTVENVIATNLAKNAKYLKIRGVANIAEDGEPQKPGQYIIHCLGESYKYNTTHIYNMFLSLAERMQDNICLLLRTKNKKYIQYYGSQYITLMKDIANDGIVSAGITYIDGSAIEEGDTISIAGVNTVSIAKTPVGVVNPINALNPRYYISVDNLTITGTQYVGGVAGYTTDDNIYAHTQGHVINCNISVNGNYAGASLDTIEAKQQFRQLFNVSILQVTIT